MTLYLRIVFMICFDSVISINKKCFIFLPALCLQEHFISGRPFLWHLHSRLYFHFTFHNLIQGQPLVRCNSVACCLTWSISQFVLSLIFDDRLHGNLMPLYNLYNVSKHYLNFVILLFLLDCQKTPVSMMLHILDIFLHIKLKLFLNTNLLMLHYKNSSTVLEYN